MSIITQKEEQALILFKDRIRDISRELSWYQKTDAWLLRWLRARDLDVDKAEVMFRKNRRFRAEEHMDQVMEWRAPKLIEEEFPMQASGFDKEGCVGKYFVWEVAIVPFGSWDVRKLMSLGLKKEFLRYIDQIFENALNFLEFKSTPEDIVTQFVLILDFEGFSLRQLMSKEGIETVAEILRRFEANHPETLKAGFVVNAPKIFEILFALVKPLLTARTLAKVQVYGGNMDQWRSALLKNIHPDQLPSQYGGSNTSVQNYKISQGFDIQAEHEIFPQEEMIREEVPPGQKHTHCFFISRGSQISWNFRSLDFDIGFALTFENTEKPGRDAQVLLECARADAHLHVQKGTLISQESGNYSIIFDNSFSRFRSKTIFYAIRACCDSSEETLKIL